MLIYIITQAACRKALQRKGAGGKFSQAIVLCKSYWINGEWRDCVMCWLFFFFFHFSSQPTAYLDIHAGSEVGSRTSRTPTAQCLFVSHHFPIGPGFPLASGKVTHCRFYDTEGGFGAAMLWAFFFFKQIVVTLVWVYLHLFRVIWLSFSHFWIWVTSHGTY